MKIFIPKTVRSDLPFLSNAHVKPGVYKVKMNIHGAISVKTKEGEYLGIKLDEFFFLSKEDREAWINIAHPNIPCVIGSKINKKLK